MILKVETRHDVKNGSFFVRLVQRNEAETWCPYLNPWVWSIFLPRFIEQSLASTLYSSSSLGGILTVDFLAAATMTWQNLERGLPLGLKCLYLGVPQRNNTNAAKAEPVDTQKPRAHTPPSSKYPKMVFEKREPKLSAK